ncbi:MAG: condensation domain-containing protein, partial [Lysobacter sp.]
MSNVSSLDDGVASLLGELRQCGIRIHVDGDALRIRGAKANLTPELMQRVQRLKAQLLAFLLAAEHSGTTSTPIPRRAADEPMHLSFMQQNLWLIDRLEGSAHYNMASALSIEGCFDPLSLKRALHATVERHESLRTVFRVAADGTPRQVVLPATGFAVDEVDLTGLDHETQAAEVSRLSSLEARRPFDLGNDLMMRSTLLRLAQDRFVLLNTKHHIASDGSSLDVLLEEMCVLYEAYRKGEASPLPPLPIQYADYSVWLSQWLHGEVLEKKLSYWKQQLANLPLMHSLRLDHPRPPRRTTTGGRHSRTYMLRTSDALRALCNEHDVTLFMLEEAPFAVILSRWSGEREIVIATP